MAGYGWIPPSKCTGTFRWVPSHGGTIPPDAVPAGLDQDGGHLFVGRAHHMGDLVPAKVAPTHGCAFISYAGDEVVKHNYERSHTPDIKPTLGSHSSYPSAPPIHCYGNQSHGSFGNLRWVPSHGGSIPPDAVPAGLDKDGGHTFVGRAHHMGDLLPAKVAPNHGCAYVCYNGTEYSKNSYEVLCSTHVAWKYARGGDVPPEAVRVGHTQSGEGLFMGRTMIEGTLTPGKVHPSHGCLYIPFAGREISFPEYEVLILT